MDEKREIQEPSSAEGNSSSAPPDAATDSPPEAFDSESSHRPLFKVGEVPWDSFLKRYIWDDDTTPYLVGVSDLTQRQARSEFFAYAVFLCFLFGVVALITLSSHAPGGRSTGMSMFSFVIVCGALMLATTQHYWAATVCSAAAPGALMWLYLFAEHPKLSAIDDAVIVIFALLWMRYGLRVINIAREYEDLPQGEAPNRTRRRWGQRRR